MIFDAGIDSTFPIRLTETLLHFLWQGTLIAALALGLGVGLREAAPRVRYSLFVAALALMAFCPVLTFVGFTGHASQGENTTKLSTSRGVILPTPRQQTNATPVQGQPHTPEAAAREGKQAEDVLGLSLRRAAPGLTLLYILGVLAMAGHLCLAVGGGRRLRRSSQPAREPEILAALARAAKALGLGFVPLLAYCPHVAAPTVVGILRPTILIPLSVASGLAPAQLELLLMHEIAHLSRYDHWVNLAQRIVETFLFFHPAVWFISRRIRVEREMSCDDLVLAAGAKGTQYADSLLCMAELCRHAAVAGQVAAVSLAASGHDSNLKRRILRMVGVTSTSTVRMARTWPLALGFALLVAVGALTYHKANAKDDAAPKQENLASLKAEMMGRVEAFFLHNYRDVTARKSIEWGEVEVDKAGNRTIRYKYDATIWDKEVMVMNEIFTFAPSGKFISVKKVPGYPQKKAPRAVDLKTQKGVINLVEDFFSKNYRDITARKTIKWGQPVTQKDGNVSIAYTYEATIWDKDKKIINQVFTFNPKGEFVSVKNADAATTATKAGAKKLEK